MRVIVLLIVASLLATASRAADPQTEPQGPDRQAPAPPNDPLPLAPQVRFEAVDVFVDSGDRPLAAYQFELTARDGDALLAGLEGGDHAAFKPAPYYDPRALLQNKVIVAAFSTAADLPHGRTRVARLMVQVSGPAEPAYKATMTTAASSDGKEIPATVTVSTVPAAAADAAPRTPETSPDAPRPNPSPTSNASEGDVP